MKKIITLCVFAFVMILGTQTTFAQSIIEINALASTKANELKKVIKFNNDTEEMVYKTYQAFEHKKVDIQKIKASGETISEEDQKKFDTYLNENFRIIFTEEEFDRYQAYLNKK